MKLYHFSDLPDIPIFHPRSSHDHPDRPGLVWAIDEFHAPHYYFPRECPRVCVWPKEETSTHDRDRFFGLAETDRMIAIETGWLDRIRNGCVYRYAFDPTMFSLYEENAGYYTSTQPIVPIMVDKIDDLLGSLTELGIEVRITPSLIPMERTIPSSTVNFSMIRMRNAQR